MASSIPTQTGMSEHGKMMAHEYFRDCIHRRKCVGGELDGRIGRENWMRKLDSWMRDWMRELGERTDFPIFNFPPRKSSIEILSS